MAGWDAMHLTNFILLGRVTGLNDHSAFVFPLSITRATRNLDSFASSIGSIGYRAILFQ